MREEGVEMMGLGKEAEEETMSRCSRALIYLSIYHAEAAKC
jgi:hypothetical protein